MTDHTVDKAALAAKGLRVKPLEWEEEWKEEGEDGDVFAQAEAHPFIYQAGSYWADYWWQEEGCLFTAAIFDFPTLEAAKAAAQADYEARILAALSAHEATEADNG